MLSSISGLLFLSAACDKNLPLLIAHWARSAYSGLETGFRRPFQRLSPLLENR
jgi:hypothetical protein